MGCLTCLTTLSSFWLSASRILYGAAQQHQLTKRFTKLNKNGQPATANLVVGILAVYFTVFAPDAWINYIYTIYGVAAGIVYLLVVLSFLRLRKLHPEWERPYKARAGMLMGVIGILFTIYVIYVSMTAMDTGAWVVLVIYIALAIPFWVYAKNKQRSDPEGWTPIIISPDNHVEIE